ncbi:PhzF family phenazine biosynthesis protein [Chitiniphilus purpureus]|uniref:PhzF family phenazine biosynthesis protein n=1 Tax=Chitiniphilus purpureus TaxID=2981137 RepID=A0ABY6DM34_9NEIS|nr:PhzF family phenazine biosynthesis protein [Chitiniphilus sp. CD1]UXY15409.1 PhzF family phenazine biosynthesis protein [Chitiniphilus sp. CD1]
MPTLDYLLLNVFAERPFAGNPLAVFPQAAGLTDAQMQVIAQQLNLSETTFVSPADDGLADARVRIFTPGYELPFAGHPTLGTAYVLAQRLARPRVRLALPAGIIPVRLRDDHATLAAQPPATRPAAAAADIAMALGLPPDAVAGPPLWVDTGTEQLVVPLTDHQAVAACHPGYDAFHRVASNAKGIAQALVWARAGTQIVARFFWVQHGRIGEDHGTGSACANLGGWLLAQHVALPFATTMVQGHATGRLAHLQLALTEAGGIEVGGRIQAVGQGTLQVPDTP